MFLGAYAIAGGAEAAREASDAALRIGGTRLWEPEIRRLRAEFLARSGRDRSDIEAELDRAAHVAAMCGAPGPARLVEESRARLLEPSLPDGREALRQTVPKRSVAQHRPVPAHRVTEPAEASKDRQRLFTVRIWDEVGADGIEHRGEVRDVTSGAFRSFRTWPELTSFLAIASARSRPTCPRSGAPQERGPVDPKEEP